MNRKSNHQWPFFLGNRFSVDDAGFSVSPSLWLRNPYRFSLNGTIERTNSGAIAICLRLGLGLLIEAFVIGGFALVGLGSVVIIVQSESTSGSTDFSPLLLGVPFLVVLSVAVVTRLWLAWRGSGFVASLSSALNASAVDTTNLAAPEQQR